MIFSGAMNSAAYGQKILNNEQLLQQQQQYVNPPFTATDTDFLKFMQLMQYYQSVFGEDYVTKVYKNYYDDDDNDGDNHDDHDHHDNHDNNNHHNNWWKKWNNHDNGNHNGKGKDWWKKKKQHMKTHIVITGHQNHVGIAKMK